MLFEKGWSLCFSVLSLEWLQILLALYRFYSPVKNFVTCSTGRSESADLSLFVQSVGSCQNIWTVHRPRRCSVNFYVRLGSHSVCVCVCLHVCDYTWTLCSVMMSRCPSYASLSCSVPKEQNKVPFDAQSGKLRPKCLHLLQTNLPPRSNSLSADVLCYPAPAVWPLTYTIGIVHRDTRITHRGNMGIISVTLLTIIHTYHVRMGSERFWKS